MGGFFMIAMAGAMLAVLASLFLGVFFMTKEGPEAREKSLKMMKYRVYLQGLALVLFALAFLTSGK
jgi:hypothetical protein